MPNPPFSRRWFLYGAVALVFSSGVWYFGFRTEEIKSAGGGNPFRGKGNSQPVPVRAEAAQLLDLSVHIRAIGTVVPLNTVTVRSRVDGQLLRVTFSEGQEVAAGQLLAEIDSLPYQLRLTQMEGQMRLNESQLRTVRSDLDRFKVLNAQTLISPQQLEAQQALVAEREGSLATAQAQVEDARRQLAYTKVEAPIAGRLGLRQVDAGNIVRAGDSGGIAVITQTRPIAVMFTIPEMELQKVIEPLRAGEQLVVEAWDRGEGKVLATGSLKTVDNQIDLATGTLKLKAEFTNADEKLFPNQFVNVRLRVRTLKSALVIPSVAVQYGSRGTYVYVVDAQNKATVRDIVLGPSDAAHQSITKGVQAGELVVLEGLDRLREGRLVSIVSDDAANSVSNKNARGGEGAGDGASKKKKK